MKFVVAGVGTVGKWVASFLAMNSKVKEILIGDIDQKKAETVARDLKSRKITHTKMDVTNIEETAKLLDGAEVFINTAGYQFNVPAMKAALKAHVNYVDPGGLFHVTREQYELNNAFKSANLTALLCMGGAPGNTNIMARYAADQLDSIEEIGVFDCVHDIGEETGPIRFSWHIDSVLDGLIKNPIIFKDGKYIELQPFAGKEEIYLPEPLGLTEVIFRIHSEVFSLPISFKDKGIKYVYFKGGHPRIFTEKAKFLMDLGLANTTPINVDGKEVVPREVLRQLYNSLKPKDEIPEYIGVLRVLVKGKQGRKKVTFTIESIYKTPKGLDLVGMGTAMPLTIATLMLAREEITQTGTLFPEMCIDPQKYFKELKKMGVQPPIVKIERPLI